MSARRSSSVPRFFRLVSATCAALVLLLLVLDYCPRLHAWLHCEKHLDADDDCAVVMLANGVTTAASAIVVIAVFQRLWRETLAEPQVPLLLAPRFQRPPICGPPTAA
jgi:hypothetical protein